MTGMGVFQFWSTANWFVIKNLPIQFSKKTTVKNFTPIGKTVFHNATMIIVTISISITTD